MNAGERQVFTPTEAAALLGRSRSWVEERCRDGRLPAIRDGVRYLLRRSDLIRDGWLTPPCVHAPDAGATAAGESRQ